MNIGTPANTLSNTRSCHQNKSALRESVIGEPRLPARLAASCAAWMFCLNGLVTGMKVMTCRSTPMMLFSCFMEMNLNSRVSAMILLILSTFLCGMVTEASRIFQSMPTAWMCCDHVVNLPSCQPPVPNTSLIASRRRFSTLTRRSPISTSMRTMSSTHWNIQIPSQYPRINDEPAR